MCVYSKLFYIVHCQQVLRNGPRTKPEQRTVVRVERRSVEWCGGQVWWTSVVVDWCGGQVLWWTDVVDKCGGQVLSVTGVVDKCCGGLMWWTSVVDSVECDWCGGQVWWTSVVVD